MVILVLARFIVNIYVIIKSFINDEIIQQSIGGVMVSIATFQAVDLGSIPGQCIFWKTSKNATVKLLTFLFQRILFFIDIWSILNYLFKTKLNDQLAQALFCILYKVCILCNCGLSVVYIYYWCTWYYFYAVVAVEFTHKDIETSIHEGNVY